MDVDQGRDEFAALQERLGPVWSAIQSSPDYVHTSVVVPSVSFDQEELTKILGASFYEERLLFSLIRLRHPRARVLYLTSQPIHPDIIDYYLSLLAGLPTSHARRRVTFMSMHDAANEPLTAKVLKRPRVIERIRDWVGGTDAYLTCFVATDLERDLAVRLGIPLNGVDPRLARLGTKTGNREVFADAGVEHPAGRNDLRSRGEVTDALLHVARNRPRAKCAVVKLNAGFSGEGNALFRFPADLPADDDAARFAIDGALARLEFSAQGETEEHFLRKLTEMGGIVEEFLEADEVRSPSVQMRISPLGEVAVISTHEQVLGGSTGQVYLGCRFPAEEEYRVPLQREAVKIAQVLRRHGVVSRFAIDFLVTRDDGGPWSVHAIEINLRMGGTTHPFLALEFLTGGALDATTGSFRSTRGTEKFYFSTDTLKSPHYQGLLPEDLIDILVRHELQFLSTRETGVLFHMIGALSQFGKVGVTCIGDSPAEADELYRRTIEALDIETGAVAGEGGRIRRLLDARVPRME